MNGTKFSMHPTTTVDLNACMEMGNKAIKVGDETACLKWYSKGLAMARELKNQEKEKLFSNLIITLY